MKKQIIVISINIGNAYNFPHRSCVVQNVGCVLMFGIVDIKTAQYQEEDADQHLTNRPLLKKTLHFISNSLALYSFYHKF